MANIMAEAENIVDEPDALETTRKWEEVLKTPIMMEVCPRNIGGSWKSSQWPKMGQSEQQSIIGLDAEV